MYRSLQKIFPSSSDDTAESSLSCRFSFIVGRSSLWIHSPRRRISPRGLGLGDCWAVATRASFTTRKFLSNDCAWSRGAPARLKVGYPLEVFDLGLRLEWSRCCYFETWTSLFNLPTKPFFASVFDKPRLTKPSRNDPRYSPWYRFLED